MSSAAVVIGAIRVKKGGGRVRGKETIYNNFQSRPILRAVIIIHHSTIIMYLFC